MLLEELTHAYLRLCLVIALETTAGIFVLSFFDDLSNDPLMALRKILALIGVCLLSALFIILYLVFDWVQIYVPPTFKKLLGKE